jgi:molybdopterin molybdotransferase
VQTVDQLLTRLLDELPVLEEIREVPVPESVGRVLREPVIAPRDLPCGPVSLLDGYAMAGPVAEGDCLPVSGKRFAGDPPARLEPGTAMRIFTGALLPEGADTVIAQEAARPAEGRTVCFGRAAAPGAAVRQAGADTRQGEELLAAGTRITPSTIGLIASTGRATVPVTRRVRVALLTTGDELLAPGDAFAPGRIYDANGPMLEALLRSAGAEIVQRDRLPDDRDIIDARLREAADADLIVTSGGVSVGEADRLRAAVASLGRIDHWRVFLKPGKPLAVGNVSGTPFLGLPGNPVSTFVTFQLFVRSALHKLAGQSGAGELPVQSLPLARARRGGDRPEYIRVRRVERDGTVMLDLFADQNSGLLSSLAWADGLALVPAGAELAAGDPVAFISFGELDA